MLVDKTEFEAWMERIMGELYRISRKLDKANCCASASARSSDTGTTGR